MSIINSNIRLTGPSGKIRPPAVAGMFYPADPDELQQTVNTFLEQAQIDIAAPKAIIAPHAGYIYSGPVAARAYASLRPVRCNITRVVLLGPAHRVYVQGLALPSVSAFATPIGNIAIDQELVNKIRHYPQVTVMDSAHAEEHSLEVHLPFLQSVLHRFKLLPLVVGESSTDEVTQVLEAVWGGDETLIVISSDLSHYHSYKSAQEIDAATSDAIEHLELDKIGPDQACGCFPVRGLLNVAGKKAMQVQTLDLRNSGDTAGPRDRVVGYGAYAIHISQTLSAQHRKQLLDIARDSIRNGFKSGAALTIDVNDYDTVLREQRATFVTLKIHSKLRGCIGTTQAVSPMVQSVAESAYNAAFRDPRFAPLQADEYDRLDLSISILSPPEAVEFNSDSELLTNLKPGVDGLIIEKGAAKATFLPEVWETIPTASEFLTQLKLKAGMNIKEVPDKAWRYHSEHIE